MGCSRSDTAASNATPNPPRSYGAVPPSGRCTPVVFELDELENAAFSVYTDVQIGRLIGPLERRDCPAARALLSDSLPSVLEREFQGELY